MGKNVIFGAHTSSVHIHNKNKDTTLTAKAIYPINFTQLSTRFVFNLYFYTIMKATATKRNQFKAKSSEIKDYTLCLGNISKDFTSNNMKKKNRI